MRGGHAPRHGNWECKGRQRGRGVDVSRRGWGRRAALGGNADQRLLACIVLWIPSFERHLDVPTLLALPPLLPGHFVLGSLCLLLSFPFLHGLAPLQRRERQHAVGRQAHRLLLWRTGRPGTAFVWR